jgi:hypothetical protein
MGRCKALFLKDGEFIVGAYIQMCFGAARWERRNGMIAVNAEYATDKILSSPLINLTLA